MGWGSGARRRLALGGLLLLVVVAGCNGPASPSQVVCQSCTEGIDDAYGRNVTVARSTAVVALTESGTSQWQVRAELRGSAVERFERDPEAVQRAAEHAVQDHRLNASRDAVAAHGGTVGDVKAELRNGTLVLRYGVADLGTRDSNDVLLVDTFHTHGGEPEQWRLGADRVTLVTPAGYHFPASPPAASRVNGSAIAWSEGATISGDTYVSAVPTALGDASYARMLAVAVDVASWSAGRIFRIGLVGGLLVGVSLGIHWVYLGLGRESVPDAVTRRSVGTGVLLGVATVATSLLAAGSGLFVTLCLFGTAGFAAALHWAEHRPTAGVWASLWVLSIPFALAAGPAVAPGPSFGWVVPAAGSFLVVAVGATVAYGWQRLA